MCALPRALLTPLSAHQLPSFALWFTGVYFGVATVIGLMLLASQASVYTAGYRATYTLVALNGDVFTVRDRLRGLPVPV